MRLTVDNVSAVRGGRSLFEGLSFGLQEGECLLLKGPNGAGKTTLLRTIAGFSPSPTGRISIAGAELEIGECCHYVGHLNAIKPRLTVAENLVFWARYLGGPEPESAVETALGRLGLADLATIPAGVLSAGQRRRLALARLLVASRPLWLLDEPTASLDDASSAMLAGVVTGHLVGGGIAIAATHVALGVAGARELVLGKPRGEAA